MCIPTFAIEFAFSSYFKFVEYFSFIEFLKHFGGNQEIFLLEENLPKLLFSFPTAQIMSLSIERVTSVDFKHFTPNYGYLLDYERP